jgi:hypothetical protein
LINSIQEKIEHETHYRYRYDSIVHSRRRCMQQGNARSGTCSGTCCSTGSGSG